MNPIAKTRSIDASKPATRASCAQGPQWVPAERLGQLQVEPRSYPWLIGKGLISRRMQDICGERYASRLVDQWSGLLSSELKASLKTADTAALFHDVELCCGDQTWVFVQNVIPDRSLSLHPWLAELGDCSLGEILASLSGVERKSYEYAWLPAEDPLSARALRNADVAPGGLWARRSRILLRGAPLLAQEAFLPATGRT